MESAYLFKIDPEYELEAKKVLLSENMEGYLYEDPKYPNRPLRLYIREVKKFHEDVVVYLIRGYLDIVNKVTYPVLENGELRPKEEMFKATYEFQAAVYPEISGSGKIANLLALLTPKWLTQQLIFALEKIIGQGALLPAPITIDYTNEDKIRQEFDDVRVVNIKIDSGDDRLTGLGIRAMAHVYETDEWDRAFYQYKGRTTFIAVLFKGIWFYISSKGAILTRKKVNTEDFIKYYLPAVIRRLIRAHAI